jgi:imidazoleglycerol-phosphate dehydratase
MAGERVAERSRETAETRISLRLDLDGSGQADLATGIPFLDHMLELFTLHGLFDLTVRAEGDLAVDYHHLVEDLGLVLGGALAEALGDKKGITRYASLSLPMDETLVRVAVDLGNRPYLRYALPVLPGFVRDFNTGLFREFFQALVNEGRFNLHLVRECGEEPHHLAEACFKGVGRALDAATRPDPRRAEQVVSTKGTLEA